LGLSQAVLRCQRGLLMCRGTPRSRQACTGHTTAAWRRAWNNNTTEAPEHVRGVSARL
jgi:hypothetical protein